ncbi:hypothetical protein AG0111_0g8437 [Alternaria gaisen]|uniref:Uncharacterized protein n=1 Tax=Alternaria gaisen TaxID=167740 RepID=A0ACB6FGE5_9PLEO|nr:hypothetical protein AG0111_0g8437 [Alternaria gaisen]
MNTVLTLKSLLRTLPNITSPENHPPITISTSQFPGITALPVELWSLVVEYTVLHRIDQNAPPFNECTAALELRLAYSAKKCYTPYTPTY